MLESEGVAAGGSCGKGCLGPRFEESGFGFLSTCSSQS